MKFSVTLRSEWLLTFSQLLRAAVLGFIFFPNKFQFRKAEIVDGTTQVCVMMLMVCV